MVLNHQYRNHRAVAPIIATLMLILITAVGGGVTFSYAQDVINDNQVSSSIAIEQLTIVGWDFRDLSELRSHNGLYMKEDSAGIPDGIKSYSERVTIYIQNKGLTSIRIDELRFVGTVYEFAGSSNYMSNFVTNTFPAPQEYVILTITPDIIINSEVPELPAGKIASLVLGLDASFKMGRHAMLKLTTDNGFVIVKNMPIGSSYDIHGIDYMVKTENIEESETPETGEDEVPPVSTGKCKGLTSLAVLYKGPQPVTIEVKVKTGDPAFAVFSNINSGNTIVVTPPIGLEKLKSNTQFEIFDGGTFIASIPIHTSCSQGIDVGDVYTDATSSLEITAMGKIIVDDDDKDDKKKKKKKK